MNSSSTRCRRYWPLRAAAALVAVSQLVMPFTAVAQTPLATTPISSTATAIYLDHDGVQQTATSNVVVTYVQQVGAFAVNEGATKNGLGGNSVAVMHTITNNGNGPDLFRITVQDSVGGNNFASIDVYRDSDANGQVDPSTPSLLNGGGVTDGSARSSFDIPLAAGETYTYVVVYKLPTSWTGSSNTATVTVKSLNASLYAVPANIEVAKLDTINLVTGAAFDATFTVAAPVGVAAPTALGSWGPSPSSGPQGTTTTYTFTFRNNGADDGTPGSGVIYLRGELPPNFAYKPGTAVWSANPGQALPAGVTVMAPNQIEFQVTGQTIEALVTRVAPNSTGTLSFQVEVGSNASSGPLVSKGWHSIGDCPAANLASVATTPACAPATENMSATFTVVPTRGVELGASGLDAMSLSSVRVGSTVKFAPIAVKNTGSDFDTFRLTLEPDATTPFPSGTVFTWYQQGGAIPLQPASGAPDSVETPQVAKGATVNVELHAVLPPGTAVAAGVNYTVKATATSMVDSSESDALNLVLNDVADPLVDLTSTQAGSASDIGLGKYLNTVSDALLSVTAGGAGHTAAGEINALAGRAVYNLYIKNRDAGSLTFSLESSATPSFPGNLPAGWGVQYHLYDGASVTTSLNSAAVTQATVPGNGGQVRVLAAVTPPANTSDVANQDLYFRARATSAGGAVLDDQIRTQLSVVSSHTRGFMLSPTGGSRQVGQGGVTFFAHTLRNTGTQTCGDTTNQLKVTATVSPLQTGSNAWNVTLYKDNGTQGQFDSSDVPISSGDTLVKLPAGAEQPLIVRVQAPSGGVPGSSVNVTLTVEDQDGPATSCGTQTVADTVSVAVGQLVVEKFQLLDAGCNSALQPTAPTTITTAKPGDCIVYRSKVTNNGSSTVTNVMLHDGVPPFTTYHSVQPAAAVACTATGLSTTPTLTAPAPGGTGPLSCGNATNTLNSAGEIQLQFRVRINP